MCSKISRILVLDASAFMHGYILALVEGEHFTTPAVLEELKSLGAKASADAALSSQRVKVLSPGEECIEEVLKEASRLGDLQLLSRADLEVLALALCLKRERAAEVVVVSDDYDVQNVAAALGLKIRPLRTPGITAILEWVYYCPSCGKIYRHPPPSGICEICSSSLRRRPRRRTRISS